MSIQNLMAIYPVVIEIHSASHQECEMIRCLQCLWSYHANPTWCFWLTLGLDLWALNCSTHWLEFPVVLKQNNWRLFYYIKNNLLFISYSKYGKYLIKKIYRDIIKKGHISSSVFLSVHRLLGWFQQTPQTDTFVHICFSDNYHPPGAFVLLLILLLIVRVASGGQTSSSSNPISNRTIPKSSFTSGGEGKSQSKRREGERQTS